MKRVKVNFNFKSMALALFALVLSSNVWGAIDANSTWTATALKDIPEGSTVIICSSNGKAINNADATSSGPTKIAMTFTSSTKKISVTTTGKSLDDIVWTTSKTTNGTRFWQYGSTTKLLGLSSTGNNNAVRVTTTSSAQYNEFVMGSNGKLLKYYNAGRYIGEYVSGSDFRSYNSETATNYSSSSLIFYVMDAPSKTLSSIAVTTPPTKKNYTTCETLDLSGCVVTATYSDASEEIVTSSCTFNPANGAALTKIVTSVAVSYSSKEATITGISVSDGARDTFKDNVQGTADQYGECNYTIPSCGDKTKGTGCEGEHYKFIGWSDKQIQAGTQPTEPTGLLKAGGKHDATGATYYAVWAKEQE